MRHFNIPDPSLDSTRQMFKDLENDARDTKIDLGIGYPHLLTCLSNGGALPAIGVGSTQWSHDTESRVRGCGQIRFVGNGAQEWRTRLGKFLVQC